MIVPYYACGYFWCVSFITATIKTFDMKQLLFFSMLLVSFIGLEAQLAYNSKYDFVPGAKVIAMENFASTEIGDFPIGWKY